MSARRSASDRGAGGWSRSCRASSTVGPNEYLMLLLVPPLLWFGTVYLGSLLSLLLQSFYSINDFTAEIVREPTLRTYEQLVTQPAHIDIVRAHTLHGDRRHHRLRRHRLPGRLLHGALRDAGA